MDKKEKMKMLTNNNYERKGETNLKRQYLILIFILTIISNPVKAEEQKYKDVTEDIEIRYKWYKEIIDDNGKYYPLRKITSEDKYDKNNYKFVRSVSVNTETCSYPNEFYLIEKIDYNKYKKTYDAKTVIIENIEPQTEIKIHYENRILNYKIISHENNTMIIDLNGEKLCDRLMFYINTDNKYKISLYKDKEHEEIIIAKEFENQKISIPNIAWVLPETQFEYTAYTEILYNTSSLTEIIGSKVMCASYEKHVYKYNVKKEYYDNNYHTYVEGYIKDENDYRMYYKGEPLVINNTIEIIKEKIKEVPKIEYIYLEKEVNNIELPKECKKEIQTKIETKIIEKKIKEIPKKIYLIVAVLILIITILLIKDFVKKIIKN